MRPLVLTAILLSGCSSKGTPSAAADSTPQPAPPSFTTLLQRAAKTVGSSPKGTCGEDTQIAAAFRPPVKTVQLEGGVEAKRAAFEITKCKGCNNRTDRWFWLWRVAGSATPKIAPKPVVPPITAHHRPVVFIGRSPIGAWYAQASPAIRVPVQQALKLKGGEDALEAALLGLDDSDCGYTTCWSCGYVEHAGAKALRRLERMIKDKHPKRRTIVKKIGLQDTKLANAWLMRSAGSSDPEVAGGALDALIAWPRKKASSWYLRRLERLAGQESLWRELEIVDKLKLKEAVGVIPGVLAKPYDLDEYRLALEVKGRLEARQTAPLTRARDHIRWNVCSHDAEERKKSKTAVDRLLHAKDVDLAVALALDLATISSRQRKLAESGRLRPEKSPPCSKVRWSGARLLEQLPRPRALEITKHLARSCRKCGYLKYFVRRLSKK